MKKDVINFINLLKGEKFLFKGAEEPKNAESYLKEFDVKRDPHEFEKEFPETYLGRYGIIEEIFTNGDCGAFSMILNFVFPGGKFICVNNGDHYLYSIDDRFYDVTGDVTEKYSNTKDYILSEVSKEELIDDITMNNYCFYIRKCLI